LLLTKSHKYSYSHLFAAEGSKYTKYHKREETLTTSNMAQTDIPDAQRRIGSRDKDVPWYTDSIESRLGPSARKLLEEYSHIPADQVESHIYAIVSSLTLLPSL
jgi:hypothetical protein